MPYVFLFLCQISFGQGPETPLDAEKVLLEQSRTAQHAVPDDLLRLSAPIEAVDEFLPAPKKSPEMVSASRLMHKVPKAAQKPFDQASKLIKKNRYAEAATLLERAIAIDPEFADAHNDLGAQYVVLGRVADGEREFQKAIALDAAFAVARANLAVSEYMRGDWDGAEKEARRALSFAPSNGVSLHLLALIRAKRLQGFSAPPIGD